MNKENKVIDNISPETKIDEMKADLKKTLILIQKGLMFIPEFRENDKWFNLGWNLIEKNRKFLE